MKERSVKIVMIDDNLVVVDLQGMGGKGVPCMMNEEAFIGRLNLRGEVIRVRGSHADLQAYEETTGLMVGDDVILTGRLLQMELGPGCSAPRSTVSAISWPAMATSSHAARSRRRWTVTKSGSSQLRFQTEIGCRRVPSLAP